MSSSNGNDDARKAKCETKKAKHEAEKAQYGFLSALVKVAQKPVALVTNLLVHALPAASELGLDKLVEFVELFRVWFLG